MARTVPIITLLLLAFILVRLEPLQPYLFSDSATLNNWVSVVHTTWNSTSLWRIDRQVFALISAVFGNESILQNYLIVLAVWFAIGLILLIGRLLAILGRCNSPIEIFLLAVIGSLTTVASIFGIFGADIVLFSAIAWLPWLVLCLLVNFSQQRVNYGYLIILLAVAFKFTQSANGLSLPVSLFAILVALNARSLLHLHAGQRHVIFYCLMALAPVLFHLAFAPAVGGWRYPEGASVVQSTGVAGLVRPLVGPDPGLHVVDRIAMRDALANVTIVILGLSLLLGLITRVSRNLPAVRALALLCVSLSLVSVLDLVPAERYSEIAPLAVLTRIIPNIIVFGLAPLCIALSLIVLVMWLLAAASPRGTYAIILAACLAILSPQVRQGWAVDRVSIDSGISIREQLVLEYGPEIAAKISASPSLAMLRRVALSTMRYLTVSEHSINLARLAKPPRSAKIFVSAKSELIPLIQDHDDSTRWSTQNGGQQGNEWLLVQRSSSELDNRILVLRTGGFHTDFPRGVRFSVSKECDSQSSNPSEIPKADWSILTTISPWLGPVQFTSTGYPYFGSQSITACLLYTSPSPRD